MLQTASYNRNYLIMHRGKKQLLGQKFDYFISEKRA